LTDLVWNDEIIEIVRREKNLEAAAKKLIDTANERGGHDNTTVILLSVPEDGTFLRKKFSPWGIISGITAILIAISALIGFAWYMMQPPRTPTPTITPTGIIATNIPGTATLSPFSTPTPPPTIGPTYTPWPTNVP